MNASVTLADVLSQPIPALLTAAAAEIVTTDRFAAEPKFLGAVVERTDGSVFLLLPNGRDETERNCIVRGLIAAIFRLDTSGWPSEMTFTVTVRDGEDAPDQELATCPATGGGEQ